MIGLISTDGTVLVRAPKLGGRDVAVGVSLAATDLFRRAIAQGNAGVVEGYGTVIKKEVIYGYDIVNDYPLYVAAGQSRDAALASWRTLRIGAARASVSINRSLTFSRKSLNWNGLST